MELRALAVTEVRHKVQVNPKVKGYGRVKQPNRTMVEFRMDRPESVEVILQTDGRQRVEEIITNRVTNS